MQDVLATRLMTSSGAEAPERPSVPARGEVADKTNQLREAAKDFEALFIGQMLTVMRETIEDSGLTETEKGMGHTIYTELFDQEVARSLAGKSPLGIADLLIRQYSAQLQATVPGAKHEDVQGSSSPSGSGTRGGETEEVPDFRMPVQAHISSTFGVRQDPFTHEMSMHRGVDIAAPEGMGVRVAGAGRVVFAGFEMGYGNTVVVQHPGGFETRYAHLGKVLVSAGDSLQTGQVLGTVGSTGRSTGPHLHFEVSRNGERIDPEALLTH
jgi:murein DD-endopeptidase MepM/ murein hydrolase activator NlpD